MEILGYLSLGIMGMTLGLIGAGGSILTIPILVYLLATPFLMATSYSLVIVGSCALLATYRYRHQIQYKHALFFAVPSLIGVFMTRSLLIPHLPSFIGPVPLTKALVILLLVFMGCAGYFMIKKVPFSPDQEKEEPAYNPLKIVLLASCLGSIVGILGSGGGFLIIPILVLMMHIPMKKAVSTSLFIIMINSYVGFLSDTHYVVDFDWFTLAQYLGCSLTGMMLGISLSNYVEGQSLKKIFGYCVWGIGIFIIIEEFLLSL